MYQDALLFLTGSWAYPAIEMLWRGETHSSMALAGGICLCLINHICCGVLEDNNIFSRCLAGAGIITGVELVLVKAPSLYPYWYDEWEEQMEEFMFLGLRKTAGIAEHDFFQAFGRRIGDVYGAQIEKLSGLGLLERFGGRVRLTERGIDISNSVFCEFLSDP